MRTSLGSRWAGWRAALPLAAVMLGVGLVPKVAPAADPASGSSRRPVLTRFDWLSVMNFYRATAGLDPVTERDSFSDGARLHSRYMVSNNLITHDESPSKPRYTAAGDRAGNNGNVYATTWAETSQRGAIEAWMSTPFHALAMLDPQLRTSGFGMYADPSRKHGWRLGATVDVGRGLTGRAATGPVMWPADGMQVPLFRYGGPESPDPLTSCKGYTASAGLPIVAFIPGAPRITAHSFRQGDAARAHCVFDSHTYRNPNATVQRQVRASLAARNGVVLMPKASLNTGSRYHVSLTAGGKKIAWSFTVGEVTPPRDPQVIGAVEKAFQPRTTVGLAWRATDTQSGVATYDVQVRVATPSSGFSGWRAVVSNSGATSTSFNTSTGNTYCFRVRATDRAGNLSGWGAQRCTALPLSTTQLRFQAGWVPTAGPQYYALSADVTVTSGAAASATGTARTVALVATKCPTCGTVDVLFNGKRLARIDLNASSIQNLQIIPVARFGSLRTGTFTIVASSPTGEPVTIEGLGLSHV